MKPSSPPPFTVAVPAWVRWLAQDSSGEWWGYRAEPLRNDSGWYENEIGDYVRLGHSAATAWQQSLQVIVAEKGN